MSLTIGGPSLRAVTSVPRLECHWPLGRWGGYVGAMSIDWRGLLADILIAGIASLFLAFVVEKLFRRRAR